MFHGIGGIVGLEQLCLQSREGYFPEVLMDIPMALKPAQPNGAHISLLVREMLKRVALKVFDPFLANPLVVLFFLFEVEQLVNDLEKLPVFPIDNVHSYVELVPPLKLTFHMNSPFDTAKRIFYWWSRRNR